MSALFFSGKAVSYCLEKFKPQYFPGTIVGASSRIGHLLRNAQLTAPDTVETRETVIIGGGVSGLSAAWWLRKSGYLNFSLLELESNVGGNSQSGRNEVSAYPWGAHYLPLPGPDSQLVQSLLEELGVIQAYDLNRLPIYNEFYLCADPHERLLIQGRWQEGLVPQIGISENDRVEYQAFFHLVEGYKSARGRDGKRPFAIPVDFSSQDTDFLVLDQQSMSDFLYIRGWKSKYLHWYVNYCCRDDYGIGYDKISAWAGIHYFASRIGMGANADSQTVLTWPEGNGWLTARLRDKVAQHIRCNTLVYSIKNNKNYIEVDLIDALSLKKTRIVAQQAIFAAPRFFASHVFDEFKKEAPTYMKALHYAPWLVANITVKTVPDGKGAPLSWENVSIHGRSMGYVNATHQNLELFRQKTVLTYYMALDEKDPTTVRKEALQRSHQEWAQLVTEELETMHPGIRNNIKNIDIWIWGHGMISPTLGFVWGDDRREMKKSQGRMHFAHSDMSGISIFEEAQYRGVQAAKCVLAALGVNSNGI